MTEGIITTKGAAFASHTHKKKYNLPPFTDICLQPTAYSLKKRSFPFGAALHFGEFPGRRKDAD